MVLISLVPNQNFKGLFLKWMKPKYHISCRMVDMIGSHGTTVLLQETLGDVGSKAPLSPIKQLNMKFNVVLPPPGDFKKPDLYNRRCWRRIQHIVDELQC